MIRTLPLVISLSLVLIRHGLAQSNIPRDTSFSTRIAAAQVLKQYPFARVVETTLPEGVIVEENLVYVSYGERKLHLDLFAPGERVKHPLPGVVLIHGGGWRSGEKPMEHPMAGQLSAHGYVVATVEYRLSPEAEYPAAVYDLKAAVRWMRANAGRYGIDTAKIVVMGCSSGGHLAAFVGTTNGVQKFEGTVGNMDRSSNVQAVVDIDGILDFTDPAESGKDTGSAKPSAGKAWLGASYKENPELWKEASPLQHVDRKTPPILFINSSMARFHAGRDEMIEKLKRLGIYSEVHTIPDTPHPFWLFHPWFEPTRDLAVGFLERVFNEK